MRKRRINVLLPWAGGGIKTWKKYVTAAQCQYDLVQQQIVTIKTHAKITTTKKKTDYDRVR